MIPASMSERPNSGPLLSIVLRPVLRSESEAWKLEGVCATVDPELFFPDREGPGDYNPKLAKKICESCPVISECLEYALKNNERHGIWGGKSYVERKKLRRERGMHGSSRFDFQNMPNSA